MKRCFLAFLALFLITACGIDHPELVELRDPTPWSSGGTYSFEPTLANIIRTSTHVAIVKLQGQEPYGDSTYRSICTFSVQSLLAGDSIPDRIKVLGGTAFYQEDELYLLFLSSFSSAVWPFDIFVPFNMFIFRIREDGQVDCLQALDDPETGTVRTFIPPFVKPEHNTLKFLEKYIKKGPALPKSYKLVIENPSSAFLLEKSDYIMEIVPTSLEPVPNNPYLSDVSFEVVSELKGTWAQNQLW